MESAGIEQPDACDSGHGPQLRISQNNPSNRWQVCNARDRDVACSVKLALSYGKAGRYYFSLEMLFSRCVEHFQLFSRE